MTFYSPKYEYLLPRQLSLTVPVDDMFRSLVIIAAALVYQTFQTQEDEEEDKYLGELEHLKGGKQRHYTAAVTDITTEDADGDRIRGVPENLKGQEMKFSPPRLSDEEERSPHMPDYLLCDGCVAVATQLQLGFLRAHRHTSLESRIQHWHVIQTIEDTCQYKTFEY